MIKRRYKSPHYDNSGNHNPTYMYDHSQAAILAAVQRSRQQNVYSKYSHQDIAQVYLRQQEHTRQVPSLRSNLPRINNRTDLQSPTGLPTLSQQNSLIKLLPQVIGQPSSRLNHLSKSPAAQYSRHNRNYLQSMSIDVNGQKVMMQDSGVRSPMELARSIDYSGVRSSAISPIAKLQAKPRLQIVPEDRRL